jgi:serine/threonine protein phosphatase 1
MEVERFRSQRRTIAIGDIHGCLTALDALIGAIRPSAEDVIVTLGDYIDRGPDSRGVLDRLIELSHRCRLVPLRGNHEEMLFEARANAYPLEYFLAVGGDATLGSYGPGLDFSLIPDGHIRFLEGCLDFHETETHIFVHANYFPDIPMAEQNVGVLRWESLRDMTPGPHESGKTVIVGHTAQKSGQILDLGHLVCIDTYCHGGGWLTALDVGTGAMWQANQSGELRQA